MGLGPRAALLLSLLLATAHTALPQRAALSDPPASQFGADLLASLKPEAVVQLEPLLGQNWPHDLSLEQLLRGFAYRGAAYRLRRVVHDLLRGKPVRLAAIGGSISTGMGSSDPPNKCWVSLLQSWLRKAFPKASLVNAAVGGTKADFFTLCLESCIGTEMDLVLTEFVLNNGYTAQMTNSPQCADVVRTEEHLVQRVLGLPSRPAMAMVQVFSHGMGYQADSSTLPPGVGKEFHETSEDQYLPLARYYDVQVLSLRDAVWLPAKAYNDSKLSLDKVMSPDHFHPSDLGHKIMADMVVWMIQQTAIDLAMRPFGSLDAERAAAPAPPRPMCRDNLVVGGANLCFTGERLKSVAKIAKGFNFTDEGRKKPGFVATEPGSKLELHFSSQRSGSDAPVHIMLAHLKSYEGMGIASIRCESGCRCMAGIMDSHHMDHSSQTFLQKLQVTQDPNCVVSITVQGSSSSGSGHKVKLLGLMVEAVPNPSGSPNPNAQWFDTAT